MRYFFIASLLLVLFAAGAATAGPVWCGGDRWSCMDRPEEPNRFCGPGENFFGGFHHGFWGGGCWGPWGCGWVDLGEKRQERFETRYDDFVADYDAAVAEDPDFYDSDLYQDMIDRFERLVDRYDRFVSREESLGDRLDDCVDRINDRIDYLNTLLEEGPPDDLPGRCEERFEEHINRKLDVLNDRLDCLTEKKDTLAGNLEDYLAFQADLQAYLDEIIEAGQDTGETAMAMADWSAADEDEALASVGDTGVFSERSAPMLAAAGGSVPEPGSVVLLAGALIGLLFRRAWRAAR